MQTLTIGRSATNNIVLNDEMVSRHHAELIIMDNGQFLLKDLESSNGTFVNGNRIKECYLNKGDIVKCATTFLKWSQYVTETAMPHPDPEPVHIPVPNTVPSENFNLATSFKYIFTRIFSIGDLVKKEWNMTPSITFFSLTPLVTVFILCLILFAKAGTGFTQIVIYPFILSIFLFGVPQLLTLTLFSVSKDSNFTKNFLFSSIFSFLQFLDLVIIGIAALLIYLAASGEVNTFSRGNQFPILISIIYTLALSALISVFVTLVVLLYKYFRAIGVTKGVGIHLTILCFAVNAIFQFLFMYVFIVILIKNNNFLQSIIDF